MELIEYKNKKISSLKKQYNHQMTTELLNYYKNIRELKNQYNILKKSIEIDFKKNINLVKNMQPQNLKNIKNKKALLIGINYTNTSYQLNGCINDVNLISNCIQNRNFSEVITITDKTELKPTRDNIISSLENFLSNASDNDFLYFHYSGHGSTEQDNNSDEKDNQDETIVSSDLFNIKDDDIIQIIKNKLTSKATLFAIFDSCHSGSILDLKYSFSENRGKLSINEEQNYNDIHPNIIMISGCADNQYSEETLTDKGIGGLMTWAFNEVITNKKNLSWKDLYLNIKNLLRNIKARQVPQLSMGSLININDKCLF